VQSVFVPLQLAPSSLTQPILPNWSFHLFNVNLGASSNAAVEQEALEKVGSYGRQIGHLAEALELIVGKLLPYGMVGLIDVVLVLSVAIFWFHVPMRGSYVLLFGLTLVYLLTTLGLGLFVSTISSTQQQAMTTSTFFFLLPMVLLSGFVFPIENMPAAIQPLTYLIPLRYFLVILRSIFLKGVGLETLWPQALALAGWGVGILLLAIARSTKRSA